MMLRLMYLDGEGWVEYYRQPRSAVEAMQMVLEMRSRQPDKRWRVVQILDL